MGSWRSVMAATSRALDPVGARMEDLARERDQAVEVLRLVTGALDDAIKCVVNGGGGWTQEHYDAWDAAREKAEALLAEVERA